MGYVYMITNTKNQKSYIGISIHEPENDRIKKHLSGNGNRALANAIKKYDRDAFTYEILEDSVFDQFLPDLEIAYIAKFNTVSPNGYNLTYGGEFNTNPSKETRLKMSKSNTGKKHTAEHRRKISEAHKGRKRSPEARRKMSEAKIGKIGNKHTAEHRRKISEAHKGKIKSAEHLRKISEANTGKKHSAESKRKMSEAKLSPFYTLVYEMFLTLPESMTIKEKHKLLYEKFSQIKRPTIRKWTLKWRSK